MRGSVKRTEVIARNYRGPRARACAERRVDVARIEREWGHRRRRRKFSVPARGPRAKFCVLTRWGPSREVFLTSIPLRADFSLAKDR